ncbi:hypothetical protein [Epilithonimonas sp. UC225_85]|uniref:hypothetical protein n=1 Tax=Epilithonimonas sp. UC225_85 TaxID=3350167 RepID=UPI0036D4223C
MKNWILILLLFIFCSCTAKSVKLGYYISTLDNIKELPPTGKESKIIDSLNQKSNEFSEKCKRENLSCFIDEVKTWAEFKGGANNFREVLFNNFKLPKNALEGENRIRVTVGKNNNLEKIEILKYTDINTKAAVEEVFKLKELDHWASAKIYNIPVRTQFEISIFIVANNNK